MATLPPISRSFSSELHVVQDGFKCLPSTPNNFSRKAQGLFPANDRLTRVKMNRGINLSREGDHGTRAKYFHKTNEAPGLSSGHDKTGISEVNASESESTEKHRKSLDSYLEKLQSQANQYPSSYAGDITELDDPNSPLQVTKGLGSLEGYIGTLEGAKSEEFFPSTAATNTPMSNVTEDSVIGDIESGQTRQLKGFAGLRFKRSAIYARKSASSPLYDEKKSANLYLISALLSINIAVFLFEIASPVKNSDYDLYSLPLVYGAKVNDLIMVGEWWRLVTPMFLHSGVLHIALSSWVLLSFGPQVCKGYGSFTFLLIYILGGISGNFASFLHTLEPTVAGSGPVFAVIGAWLIYQIQNKDVTDKELSETMYQKAVIATALSFVLGNFGPIDNWTNLGAAISGIIYGFFTCPVLLQVDDGSTKAALQDRIKQGITLVRQQANPCKSLMIFTLFLSLLSSLLFFAESSLDKLEFEELLQIIE